MKGSVRVGAGVAATLLAAAAGAVYLRPMAVLDVALRAKLWSSGARGGWVRVDGEEIFYLRAPAKGRPQTVPLLLIHGLGARSLDWAALIPGLQAAGHDVIVVDLPGYGRSAKPEHAGYTIAEQERAVVGVLRELGIAVADVAGWSMGGWIAMKIAADHPERVRRLVLFDSAGVDFELPYEPSIFTPKDVDGVQRLVARLTPQARRMPRFVAKDLLRRARPTRWVMRRSVDAMLGGRDLMQHRLREIGQPTLVFWGEEDQLIPIEAGERIAEGIPNASLVRLPGCGHLAPTEGAALILPRMTRFSAGDELGPGRDLPLKGLRLGQAHVAQNAATQGQRHIGRGLRLIVKGGDAGEEGRSGLRHAQHVVQVDAIEGRLAQAQDERTPLFEADVGCPVHKAGREAGADGRKRAHGARQHNHGGGRIAARGDVGPDVGVCVQQHLGGGVTEKTLHQVGPARQVELFGLHAECAVREHQIDVLNARIGIEQGEHGAGEDGAAGAGDGERDRPWSGTVSHGFQACWPRTR